MTGEAFEAGMARLAAMWPGRSPSGDTAAVYAEILMPLDDGVWQRAVALCLRECTFFPTPAEILARAEDLLTEAGVLPDTATDAWAAVLLAVRSAPGEPTLLAPLTREVIGMVGGVYALRVAEDAAEVASIRRQFVDIYTARRQRLLRQPAALGQPLPAPVVALARGTR